MTSAGFRSRPEKTAMILARRVVDDIRRGGLGVGHRLPPERVMLEEYQVGRGTLREALRYLELQKVISLKPGPGGGPTVEKPDASMLATAMTLLLQFDDAPMSDVVESRRDLEPLMARLAAERMTADELARIADNVDRMRGGLHDERVFRRTDQEFHDLIAAGTHNAVYGFLIEALLTMLEGSALSVAYPENQRAAVLADHTSILECLQAHDGAEAYASMERHMGDHVSFVTEEQPILRSRRVTWGVA